MSEPSPQAALPSSLPSTYWTVHYRRPGASGGWHQEDWGTRDNAENRYEHLRRTGRDVKLYEITSVRLRHDSAITDPDVETERDV